jgi:hypothetical protein
MTRTRTRTPLAYSCRNLSATERKRATYCWTQQQLDDAQKVHDMGCYSTHHRTSLSDYLPRHHCSFAYYLTQAQAGVFANEYSSCHLNAWCIRTVQLQKLVPDFPTLLDILMVAYGRGTPTTLQPPELNAHTFDV